MTKISITLRALAAALLLGGGAVAHAQDSGALLDALVRKKVLTSQEAEDVRADLVRENATSNAGKLQLSNSITSLKLYGDVRLRYQNDTKDPQVAVVTGVDQRSRERIRLRLNGDFTLAGGFFGGVQLQTIQNADSGNQTMGDSGTGAAGFSNYNIYISRAYFGWGNDWLTLVGGKQPNPFYTTDLIWDADINPEGFVEKVDLIKAFSALTTNDSTLQSESRFELSLVAGQFVFCDNNEYNPSNLGNTDAWLFNTQLIASAKLTDKVKLTVAPGYMTYTSGNVTNSVTGGAAGKFNETAFYGKDATRNLSIVTAPGDVSFTLCGLKAKVLWDLGYNTAGAKRAEAIYGLNGRTTSAHSHQDDLAWLAGVQFGENKKAGDWSVLANFRQTGLTAVDPNLNDSDFALGQLNMQGIKVGAAYNFTDFCVGAVTYYDAWNLRSDLFGGQTTANQKIANANAVQILQVDLNVKF
ncbi:MAG: putative porin [Verrucomicrobia bacterium]|nr:putative porin [Verrucomicrobiota bacterium]